MIKVAEKFDANIIFRSKATNPFLEEYYFDSIRAKALKKMMNEEGVIFTNRTDYDDLMSILFLADIVVYNRVGTLTMIALLLDIPAFSFCDNADDIPDPIMKHYVNDLVFATKNY